MTLTHDQYTPDEEGVPSRPLPLLLIVGLSCSSAIRRILFTVWLLFCALFGSSAPMRLAGKSRCGV